MEKVQQRQRVKMSNFDDILKKGKQAGSVIDPKRSWKECVTAIMYELHRLNNMYGDSFAHHSMVEQKKCEVCGVCTFILAVRELDDHKKVLKYHKADWKPSGEGKYLCEICKKGR